MNERTLALTMISGMILAFVCGLASLFLRKLRSKTARPLFSFALLGLVICFVFAWISVVENGFRPRQWSVGWIVSAPEITKVHVGVLFDSIGLLVGSVATLLCLLILFVSPPFEKTFREDRSVGALCVSVTGVVLAWLSISPWLVFVGMLFAIFGGFVSLTDSGKGEAEKGRDSEDPAPRFLLEKVIGFFLCLGGAIMLTGTGVEASWPATQAWHAGGETHVAAALFCLGTILQFGAFPLTPGGVLVQSWSVPARFFCVQLAPAWVSFVFLFRLHQQLIDVEMFPVLGGFILAAAILSAVTGFFQPSWRRSFATAISVSFCLVCAALVFSSTLTALALLIAVGFSGLAVAISAQLSSDGPAAEQIRRKKIQIDGVTVLVVAGSLALSGSFGFLGAWAFAHWIQISSEHPLVVTVSCASAFLFMVLVWKVNWLILSIKTSNKPYWRGLVGGSLAVLGGLSVLWSGELTGLGLVPVAGGESASFLAKVVASSFLNEKALAEMTEPGLGVWIFSALIPLSILVAFMMQNTWSKLYRATPKASVFIGGGYGFSTFMSGVTSGVRRMAGWLEDVTATRIWNRWLSDNVSGLLRASSRAIYWTDEWLSRRTNQIFDRSLELSIQMPRVVQNGDVQWYLFFGIVCTILILLNFMRD